MFKKIQGSHLVATLLIILLIGLTISVGYIIISDVQKNKKILPSTNNSIIKKQPSPTAVIIKSVILEIEDSTLLPPKVIVKTGEKISLKLFIHDSSNSYGFSIKKLDITADESDSETEAIFIPKSTGEFEITTIKNGKEISNMKSILMVTQ